MSTLFLRIEGGDRVLAESENLRPGIGCVEFDGSH